MGTRGWTLSTFVGCCVWILHGLGAAAAVPVTTEGPFAAGTASPITAETEGPRSLVMGTAETSTAMANAEIAESIPTGSPASPSFPSGAEPAALVNVTKPLMNVTKPLNASQDDERGPAALTTATTSAAISAQHPAVTPEAELAVTGATPNAPLGATPLFADVKEDVLTAVTGEGAEDLDPTASAVSLPTTPLLAATWGAQQTAGSPVGAGVTVLPSRGLTTATGAVGEGVTLPVDIHSEASANFLTPSPGTGGLLTTQQDGAVSGAAGPEPVGEAAPAVEENPSASVPRDAGNDEFSTTDSSHLPPESATVSGALGNPSEPSLLPNQAALSPAASLAPAGGGDGDEQGASLDAPGAGPLPAASEAPAGTGDMATSLLAPSVPTEAHSDTNTPALATALPTEDMGAADLAELSLQPAPWQSPTGERPPLLAAALPSPTDTSSAPGAAYPTPEAAYPAPGTEAGTLPAVDYGEETPVSPDLGSAPGSPFSPSLGGSQPWGTAAGAPQGADEPYTGFNSALDALNPASFLPDGLAWPTAGVLSQGADDAGDTAQAGGPGEGSPYTDTQNDINPSAFSAQQDPANTEELLPGETGALVNAELSPPSALGAGTGAGAAPALGQVSPPGPAPPGSAGLQPDLLGPEGPGDLSGKSPSSPGAAYPPLGAAAGPVPEAETPVSSDLGAAQGAPVPLSPGGSQPWGVAAGAPQGAGLPGADGPSAGLTSAWDVPSSAAYGPAEPPSPALGVQLGTNLGSPAVERNGPSTAEQALGGAGSGTGFEPSLSSTAGSGTTAVMDQLSGAGSSSGPASPIDVVAASSTSEDDGAGPIPAAAPGPDSLSPASPDSETGPELAPAQGTQSAGDVAQAGDPESASPYMATSSSAFSAQQDPANAGEVPAGGTGALPNTVLSPPSALGDGAGAATALGQVSPPGLAPPSSAGLQPDRTVSEAETPANPDLSAAQGAPVPPSLGGSQPWGVAAGAPQAAGLPGADGPGTDLTSAWDASSSAAYGPAEPPSPALGVQLGTNPGSPAVEGNGPSTAEQALGGAGSGTGFEPSLSSAAGSGTAAGMDQPLSAGFSLGSTSPGDVVIASSISEGDGVGPIPAAAPGPDSLSPASPDSETGPELAPAQGTESAGDVAQAGDPESASPYMATSSSAFSAQQDLANAGEVPAGGTGALPNTVLSPPSALGDGAGAATALGQVSPPGLAPPSSAGLQPDRTMSEAETPANPDLSAAQGAPVPPSLGGSQPWGVAAGAPQAAGLPGADGPGTDLTSAWDVPSSAAYGPAEPPSPALGVQLGTNLGSPAVEGNGPSTAEQALGGAGGGTGFEPSLSSAAGSGTTAVMDQLSGAGSSSGPASPIDVVAASSVSEGDGVGPISAAAPGPVDSLSPASPDSETGPELVPAQGTESAGDVAQAGGPESASPYTATSSSAFSAQQDPANTEELLPGETGALVNAELSPPSALGAGTGAAPALGQVSPPGPAPPGSAGLQPDLLGPEGPGDLSGKSPSFPGAAYPPLGAAAGPVPEAETPVSSDLGAAQGAPVPASPGGSQPWGVAAGAPQGAGLPGADGPSAGLTSAWDTPSSATYGLAEPPSPALGVQLGTNLGLPGEEGLGAGTAEQVLGGVGVGTAFEPSLSSTAGSGTAAGMDQLPGEGSLAGPASPSGAVAASSVSDPVSPSALAGMGGAPGAPQPSLAAAPAAGEGAVEAAGDGGSLGQPQAPANVRPSGSGAPDGEMGATLQSASSSPSVEGSSSAGTASDAANGASLPGAGAAGGGISTGLEAAGPQEPPVSAPGIQSGADLGLSEAKLSQVNVVELPGGASVNAGLSSGASLGEGTGAIIQIASGALAPSALASPREMQPLVPVAPDGNGISDGTATSLGASPLLPGHGLSLGLAPSRDPHSVPSTQSGSRTLVSGALSGLTGDAGGAQMSSLEDEVASGMPAPLGEASLRAPASPSAALALPSAPQRENAAVGLSSGPGLSAPLSARESIAGSSAGGRGELGAAVPGARALLLPPHPPGSPRAPSEDADSPMPGKEGAVLPGVMARRGDMAQLLSSATRAGAGVETPTRSPLGGSPGLPGLPPTGIAAGSPGSNIPGPGPAGGSSPAALQPFLGGGATTSLANGAPAAGGSSLSTAFPDQGGARGGSPTTTRPNVSCSPAVTSPAPPAPLPGGREGLPRPGAATVTSRVPSPMFPAPPGWPAAAPTPLPSPTVAAVPLYGYGARENDLEYVERRVDFNSPLFKPETGFPFGRTLRNSLYFTDNGQIIFPASDNSIFTYPNPPPSGFNGHEDVPMIAVFWDNADFSRGVGTTFYQEFLTLNTAKPPFVRDVEEKVRRYLRSSYSAAWTLKITWEKAPAYAARTDTRRTITYQAILTTDGFRSYVLMLYQAGGMQWDYTRLAATNVLIGYTSGDGFYRNDDLTQRPPAAKYRPDQFRGYNTDLRGLWIYKLESRVAVNYRLKCLAWTGRQQEPRVWSQGLPACPCSLQQGQQDPRFKSSRGGWWAARVSMLHSTSPNKHGAGVRCLYDSQSRLIEGRQERYWRSSRQASPYRDQELKLYAWCCNQPGSTRLCARYSEKRPKIGCDGYQPPGTDSSAEAESDSEEQRDEEDK